MVAPIGVSGAAMRGAPSWVAMVGKAATSTVGMPAFSMSLCKITAER